jgi:hypothetical protein
VSAPLRLSAESLRDVALEQGVCIRPVMHEVLDTVTGVTRHIATACGATRESKCPPCAVRNRRLRMQQCREGWHLEEEPERQGSPGREDDDLAGEENDDGRVEVPRRVRSTRRRQDAPDLPRVPVEPRTVGAAFVSSSGRTYRPSMFVTLTLPSYGLVERDGTPRVGRYDYRRAALDALHFPKLVDRFWQNLRRAAGYRVQYFATVEEQHRLAPHLHAAVRGAIPRAVVRQVVAATYHQVWWPPHDEVMFDQDRLPTWTEPAGYVDRVTGAALATWEQAMDLLDADVNARPAHVVRFGRQMDLQGIVATEDDADRRVAYLTKYLTKSISGVCGDVDELTPRQLRHQRRLAEEVRFLPCSPRCWNWLRFGVQPADAHPGMVPGSCRGKAHDPENLGCGGRRVLVSRLWTGKTLKGHAADRAEVVRQVLDAAGITVPDAQCLAADVLRADGQPRYAWRIWDPMGSTVPMYRQVMSRAIGERMRWKAEYAAAKERLSLAGQGGEPRVPP